MHTFSKENNKDNQIFKKVIQTCQTKSIGTVLLSSIYINVESALEFSNS